MATVSTSDVQAGRASEDVRWKRALLGGLLAEILVYVIIIPVGLVVGFDNLQHPAFTIVILAGSFFAPVVLTQWVARRVASRFVLHGLLVGVGAFLFYMALVAVGYLLGPPPPQDPAQQLILGQPPIYWVAHTLKILGGVTGGLVAMRRHGIRGMAVSV